MLLSTVQSATRQLRVGNLYRIIGSNIRRMSLSNFLVDSKQRYLRAIQEGKGRDWIVVMGNEAGDLDSVASSIAYAWFGSVVREWSCVALLQTPRNDLVLRPENIHAFRLASLSATREELLCIDDVPRSMPFPSNRFVLVDHNRLQPQFHDRNEDVKVIALLDHHDDEGLYKDTADPRIIVLPTGSAASIVARYIEQHTSQIPSDIAKLLLCAIVLDTNGLTPGGKAEELDRMASAYLLPRCDLGVASLSPIIHSNPVITELTYELVEKKFDVTQLSTKDLLRRDYKQYSWSAKTRPVRVGLSTVPLDLSLWFARGPVEVFWLDLDAFMDERSLDILGILTTFRKEKLPSKKKQGKYEKENHEGHGQKGKHKRQILLVIRDVPGESLEERLCEGFDGAPELGVERRSVFKIATKHRKEDKHANVPADGGVGDRRVHVFKQGNTKATRKIIAPMMKAIIENQFDDFQCK